jgi:hypothetical protein
MSMRNKFMITMVFVLCLGGFIVGMTINTNLNSSMILNSKTNDLTEIGVGKTAINGFNGESNSFEKQENIKYDPNVDSTEVVKEANRKKGYNQVTITNNTTKLRPVYITSDNIYNKKSDTDRITQLSQKLKLKGLKVVNYGLGPNFHYTVLKDSNVPKNALIVNVYGGVCAGTIWEMNTKSYKYYRGNRSVFSVWIKTKINIDKIEFLRRASDDNFTPLYKTPGGFPDAYDIDKNGIIEPGQPKREDGLKNPAKYLKSWGYHYIYMPQMDLNKLSERIYQEAKL